MSRPTIYKYIDKAQAAGPGAGLKDHYLRPFDSIITNEAKAWVINLACTKPKDHRLAAESWTLKELAKYSRIYSLKAGHNCLSKTMKTTIWQILSADAIKSHKIVYYLEQRYPAFDQKCRKCSWYTRK